MTDDETLLAELLAQEDRLQLARFEHEDAFRLGMRLVERARAAAMALTIQITRVHQVLFQVATAGTVLDNDHWVRRKTATVYRFGHSSFYMGVSCRARGVTLAERYGVDPVDFAEHGGAFPIRVRGAGLVGVVAVSGLPQAEDHRLVVETLERHIAGA
ncbi:MAG: heme-degrading domain-containing protein [Geminicoccaceae bacterium]